MLPEEEAAERQAAQGEAAAAGQARRVEQEPEGKTVTRPWAVRTLVVQLELRLQELDKQLEALGMLPGAVGIQVVRMQAAPGKFAAALALVAAAREQLVAGMPAQCGTNVTDGASEHERNVASVCSSKQIHTQMRSNDLSGQMYMHTASKILQTKILAMLCRSRGCARTRFRMRLYTC